MKTVSIGGMIERIEGLLGTNDLNMWEGAFVEKVVSTYRRNHNDTRGLSDKQVEKIEEIFSRHFAG